MRFYAFIFCGLLGAGLHDACFNDASGAPLSTPSEIQAALIGSTISGVEKGEIYFEYFDPSGKLFGENREGRYEGRWRIQNAQICLNYNDEPANAWDCLHIDIDGSQLIWTDSEGEKTMSKRIPGRLGGG